MSGSQLNNIKNNKKKSLFHGGFLGMDWGAGEMVLDLFFKLAGAWAWMGVSFYTFFPLLFQKSRTLG